MIQVSDVNKKLKEWLRIAKYGFSARRAMFLMFVITTIM
jgi:hypothetical protein